MTNCKAFMKKANRDAFAKEMKKQGYKVKKFSVRNKLLHPMYLADYESETGHELTESEKGFGNTLYKTPFDVIYFCYYWRA